MLPVKPREWATDPGHIHRGRHGNMGQIKQAQTAVYKVPNNDNRLCTQTNKRVFTLKCTHTVETLKWT